MIITDKVLGPRDTPTMRGWAPASKPQQDTQIKAGRGQRETKVTKPLNTMRADETLHPLVPYS